MPMKCNIDRRGQQLRGLWGVLNLILAAVCVYMYLFSSSPNLYWIIGAVLLFICGAFGIFEYCFSWCALRAMKIKTPF